MGRKTWNYVELSKVRHSYLEYPTPNSGTIWNLALYKNLLQLSYQLSSKELKNSTKKKPIKINTSKTKITSTTQDQITINIDQMGNVELLLIFLV